MLIWFLIFLTSAKVHSVPLKFSPVKLIEKEYAFGLLNFQDSVNLSEDNITESEVKFLDDNINQLVLYAENLTLLAKNLFDDYGFIVEAKRVYLFVSDVRRRIKMGTNQLMKGFSANLVKKSFSKIYQDYSIGLKKVFDKEISRILKAVDRDEYVLECWEAYKLLIFELGFDIVNDLKALSLSEVEKLSKLYEHMKEDISAKSIQSTNDLSAKHSTLFSARLSVNTYIEENREKILDQIDNWFLLIATSLQQATANVQLGAEKFVREAEVRFEGLSREIVDCITHE